MAQQEKPHRRLVVSIEIGADDLREIEGALDSIQFRFVEAQHRDEALGSIDVTSGGVGAGWSLRVKEDKEMTHDKYFEAIKKWKEAKNATDI